MTGIESWSTTAASNNAATPNGWPEGQAPSTVNDCARQNMASIRTWYQDAEWVPWGDTCTYVSSTSFKISGSDVTARYSVGRRVRAVGSSTGTIYGKIITSAFSTDTTVTLVWDSGSLSNETLTISLAAVKGASASARSVDLDAVTFHGGDIASATTIVLDSATGDLVDVTGTTAITTITLAEGRQRTVRFTGILTLTNGSNLVLPSGANITTAAGDYAVFRGYSSSVVRCVFYSKTSGAPITAAAADPSINDFRLTLTTATPVTTSDVTGATTVYCTPYKGNGIALYDGSSTWNLRTSAEFSLALGTLTSGKPYDVFCYDNSTVPTLEFLVWTNDTTRATALVYQNGVLVKSGATTRRYLGTFYTTATTTTEDSLAKRYLYNYYNRVRREMKVTDATATWTYTTATIRQTNANTANQLNFLLGVAEDDVEAMAISQWTSSGSAIGVQIGIGVDSTTTFSGLTGLISGDGSAVNDTICAFYRGLPAAGRHFLSWNEWSTASGTTTWTGTSGNTTCGIQGSIMA